MPQDSIHHFFTEAHSLTSESKFMINALPNAEIRAVESMVHKLYAVRSILRDLDDPSSMAEELEHLVCYVESYTLEAFRKIFDYLEKNGLLNMENSIQRLCLYVVFQPRIQASLRRTADAWNHHRMRTAGHKTPIALYELSREHAKTRGYWTGDPGDDLYTATQSSYGCEDNGTPTDHQVPEEESLETQINDADDISYVRKTFQDMGFDVERDDGNWGIEVYTEAVLRFKTFVEGQS
ncbi:hypothetical protein C8J55DRAFT_441015 [Lentinula edodes]|uniref:Integrase core domain-containing protein n=1 Tax=Lentinula lateritia TaxID=40482 RepID=A0A9W8ZSC8_9AGAR|nr:hypothetical protein C8J55DRAFT_441015 [Lentinula edodes]